MNIYTLDSHLRRVNVYDKYVSFIWTERYNSYGDFELVLRDSTAMRKAFEVGTFVYILQSKRVMIVDTIEGKFDANGSKTIKITGKSLEFLLYGRSGMDMPPTTLTLKSKWEFTGTVKQILHDMYWNSCGTSTGMDPIPWVNTSDVATGNLLFPSDSISVSLELTDLYSAIMQIAQQYNIGFGIVMPTYGAVETLNAGPYRGSDRTMIQTIFPPVVFSSSLNTLSNITSIRSLANYKNVAYVIAPNGTMTVYGDYVDSSVSGFDKKALVVTADDITTEAGATLNAQLTLRGKQELAKYRVALAFDGEIPKTTGYVYGKDYGLGDLVDMENTDGNLNHMYVMEQIFVSDKEGDRSYPTLVFDSIVSPGTWAALSPSLVWSAATGKWIDM